MKGMPIGDFSTFCGGFGAGQMQSFGPMINPMPNSVFNNCQLNGGKEGAAFSGMAYVAKMQLSSDLSPNGLLGRLGSMETSLGYIKSNLEELLKCDSIDDKQKEAIRTELAKVEENLSKVRTKKAEFQSKFGQLIGNPNLKEVLEGMSYEELSALQQQINDIGVFDTQKEFDKTKTEVQNLSDGIKSSLAQKAQDGQNAGASDGTAVDGSAVDGNADGASSGSTTKVGEGDTAVEVDNETGRPAGLGAAPSRAELASTCLKIRQSITCMGTNHNVLDPIIQGLDETNIIEIVKYWEDNYNKGNKTKESFFEKIFDDVGDDWQSTYIPIMREALAKRAEALGIGDEVEAELAIVDMELTKGTSWKKLWCGSWQDDHKLAKGLKAAYELIKNKEAANATAAKDKVTEDKTKAEKAESDAKAKEAEEKRQKYADFRNDMFQYWGITDEDAQMVNVYYENGQYRAHVNGKDYYGKSFREILAAIEKAKDTDASGKEIDPKKYLIGKSE